MLVRPEDINNEGILDVADAEEKTPVFSPNILEVDLVGGIFVGVRTDSGVLEKGEEVTDPEAKLESILELVEVEGEILLEFEAGVNPDVDMVMVDEPELEDSLMPNSLAVA